MRKLAKISSLFMALLMGAGIVAGINNQVKFVSAAGTDSTYQMTIDSSATGKNNVHWTSTSQETVAYSNITWNLSVVGTTSITASTTQCQIGSKNSPATKVSISTGNFGGKTIKSVALTGFCMSNTGPALTITAGSTVLLASTNLVKTTSTEYTGTKTCTLGSTDALTFEITSSASAAIVVSKIKVVYSDETPTTFKVTYNANGLKNVTMPTDSTEYDSGAEVTVKSKPTDFDDNNYQWLGWSLTTTGDVVAKFNISEDTVLYARYTYIGPGTEGNPYTVDQMIAAIDSSPRPTQMVWVAGVAASSSYNSTYKNYEVVLKHATASVKFYRAQVDSSITEDLTGVNAMINRTVTCKGTLTKYGSTYELAEGCVITAISAKIELDSITLTGQKTRYALNDEFSFTGTCTAHYSNSTTAEVTPTEVSEPDMTTAGQKTITVSYTEGTTTKTAEYTINVVDVNITVDTTAIEKIIGDSPVTRTVTATSGFEGTVTYTWASTDSDVAPVVGDGASGTISFLAKGNTVVSVTATDGVDTVVREIEVSVDRAPSPITGMYALVKGASDLVEGEHYIISNVASEGSVVVMDSGSSIGNNVPVASSSLSANYIEMTSTSQPLVVTLEKSGANWMFYLENYSSNGYLTASNTTGNNYLKFTETADKYCVFSISINDKYEAVVTCTGKSSRNIMRYNSSSSCFSCYGSGQNPIQLYRQKVETKVYEYADSFLNAGLCDGGKTAPSVTTWTTLATSFNNLDADDKALFAAVDANESGNNFEKVAARYDLIVGKYGKDTYADFMSRNPESLKSPAGANVVFGGTIDSSSTAIISIIATVSLLAFATIVVRKKRKEN